MTRYFFRLDDIAPNMNWDNFYRLKEIFGKYGVKPLFAVVPDAQDPKLMKWPIKENFWEIMKEIRSSGWIMGQHGYQHLSTGNGGILKIHKSGEFGGLDFTEQKSMIVKGGRIMKDKTGVAPKIFIAPWHSFDKNTVNALKANSFELISDGISLYPFKKWGIVWLPQILWRPRKWLFGTITIALHSNTMNPEEIINLEKFIKENQNKIGNFPELIEWHKRSGPIKRVMTLLINLPFKIIWRSIFLLKYGLSR